MLQENVILFYNISHVLWHLNFCISSPHLNYRLFLETPFSTIVQARYFRLKLLFHLRLLIIAFTIKTLHWHLTIILSVGVTFNQELILPSNKILKRLFLFLNNVLEVFTLVLSQVNMIYCIIPLKLRKACLFASPLIRFQRHTEVVNTFMLIKSNN